MGIFNIFKKKKPAATRQKLEHLGGKQAGGGPIKRAPMKRKEGLAYRLLKEPHISEKATKLSEDGKYVFKIYSQTNKSEIKKAIANLYGVAVKDVNIINIKTKKRLLRGKEGKKHGYKKAIVTLEKGHKIEILPH